MLVSRRQFGVGGILLSLGLALGRIYQEPMRLAVFKKPGNVIWMWGNTDPDAHKGAFHAYDEDTLEKVSNEPVFFLRGANEDRSGTQIMLKNGHAKYVQDGDYVDYIS